VHSAVLEVEVRGWRMAEVVDPDLTQAMFGPTLHTLHVHFLCRRLDHYHRRTPIPSLEEPYPTFSGQSRPEGSATASQCASGPPVPHTLP